MENENTTLSRVNKNKKKRLKPILIALLFVIGLGLFGYISILYTGSSIVDEDAFNLDETTVLETEDGTSIAELYKENRKFITINEIPEYVQQAYLAIEDRRFYDHRGVDLKSVARAVYRDIIAMSKVEGASTITQQLAKNLFLTNEKTWTRKAKEVAAAIYMEQILSKDEILELYLNEIYFGQGIYGIETAANYFYSKSTADLNLAEAAMLAGLAKAPNGYSPINYPEKALDRRNVVLSSMENAGYITGEEKQEAQEKTLGLEIAEKEVRPWIDSYVDLVIKEAQEKQQISIEQLRTEGYRIVVGMDPAIQQIAYKKFQNEDYFPGNTAGVEGAFVMMENETGKIVSTIGGRDYQLGDLNRATVKRQPGSTFKPLAVYGPALMLTERYNPYTLLPDDPKVNETYLVANVDGNYAQTVSLYDSIVQSKNVPAVWLLDQIGINYSKNYLEKMGISIIDDDLAIALGGLYEGTTPLEIMEAYRTFAANGKVTDSYTIEAIYDADDELIYEADPEEEEIFTPQVAWNMTEILSNAVPTQGNNFSKALAGKTGTTEHPHVEGMIKDVWFAGYTSDYAAVSWMGYDVSDESHYLTGGSTYPTRITTDILAEADEINPMEAAFIKPAEVESLPEPVQLGVVENVRANYEFGGLSLVRARLTWDGLDDSRIIYRIYEERDGVDARVGEVEGETEFIIDHALFKNKKYYIVAYDPLTKLEGSKSETVQLKF